MKKMVLCISFFVASLVLFGSLDSFASKASAETHTYDGKSPYYNGCANSAVTKKSVKIYANGGSANLELKFSPVCKTAWAKITLSRPAKADGEATALVVRNTDNKQFSCASPGGNGEINKGQTSCYTPMVYDLDPRKAKAVAFWPYTAGETDWY
ncbi:YjfA family protein [Peribacillus frigoritolerans]